MSVELTARDYRALTGLQGRGFNKGSTSTTSGVLKSYRGGLEINIGLLEPDQLVIGTGGIFVDGAFVENTETLNVSTDTDGTYTLVCEVDLGSNVASFKLVTGALTQNNLTETNTGIYQFKLGTAIRASGIFTTWTLDTIFIIENMYDLISNDFVDVDNNQSINGVKTFNNAIHANGGLSINGSGRNSNIISGKSDVTGVGQNVDFIDFDYENGNNLFKIWRNESSTQTGRYTSIGIGNVSEETWELQFRMYHNTTEGINHFIEGTGHQLAYKSDTFSNTIKLLQYQRSSELITIDSLGQTEVEEQTLRLAKELSARQALVDRIETDIIELIKEATNSIRFEPGFEVDIWELEPMAKLKEIVLPEIWARYESGE